MTTDLPEPSIFIRAVLETELWLTALAGRTPLGEVLRAGLDDLLLRILPLCEVRAKA